MVASKIGNYHITHGINCQDFGFEYATKSGITFKVVCDGCSDGAHSEVGAKLFCKMFEQYIKANTNFDIADNYLEAFLENFDMKKWLNLTAAMCIQKITDFFDPDKFDQDIKDYCCFTILIAVIYKPLHDFDIYYCGDGFFLFGYDNRLSSHKLDDGEYPKYLAYNFIRNRDHMATYKNDWMELTCFTKGRVCPLIIPALDYYNLTIGVASDGFRYITKLEEEEIEKFDKAILSGKSALVKRFINKYRSTFQDDITIVF